MAVRWKASAALDEYAQCMVDSHRSVRSGDEDRANELADEMEKIYPRLTQTEAYLTGGLSHDLYMLSGEEMYVPTQLSYSEIERQLLHAHDEHDGATMLPLLRHPGAVPSRVAHLRSRAYDFIGCLPAALEFRREAVRLEPSSPSFRALLVEMLVRAGLVDEAIMSARAAITRFFMVDEVVIFISCVLFKLYRDVAREELKPLLTEIGANIESRIEKIGSGGSLSILKLGFLALSGIWNELAEYDKALYYANMLVNRFPGVPEGWQARGWLRIHHGNVEDTDESDDYITDLDKAVELNTAEYFPYMALGTVRMLQEDFRSCFSLGKKLLDYAQVDSQRSYAHYLMAKSAIALGYQRHTIQRHFRLSGRLNPNFIRAQLEYKDYLNNMNVSTAEIILSSSRFRGYVLERINSVPQLQSRLPGMSLFSDIADDLLSDSRMSVLIPA